MRPRKQQTNYNNLLLLLIPTFVLIMAWIGFTIYGSRVQSTLTEGQSRQIKPIAPVFDLNVINALKNRDKVSPILTFQAPPSEDTPIGTESALSLEPIPTQPEVQNIGSESGQPLSGGTP